MNIEVMIVLAVLIVLTVFSTLSLLVQIKRLKREVNQSDDILADYAHKVDNLLKNSDSSENQLVVLDENNEITKLEAAVIYRGNLKDVDQETSGYYISYVEDYLLVLQKLDSSMDYTYFPQRDIVEGKLIKIENFQGKI